MKIRTFDLEIYALSAIQQAVQDYAHIANIRVLPLKNQVKCIFTKCRAQEQLTVQEFSNYVIDLMASQKGTV